MKLKSIPIKFQHRPHTSDEDGPQRVWREDWGGDQFEVLAPEEFGRFKAMCMRFSLPLFRASED